MAPLPRVRQSLSDYKAVKKGLGGTINDAVLAVACGAMREWLLNRGEDVPPELTLRVMAPASTRRPEEMGSGGNLVSGMFIDVPVGLADPLARYLNILEQTKTIKETGEIVAAGALMPATDFIAPNLFAIAVRSGV